MIIRHIIITVLALLLSTVLFETTNLDIWLQDGLYNFASHKWIVDRNDPVLKFVLYDGIKEIQKMRRGW